LTRIFYATDLHGSELCFLKFVNAAKFYKADVLILGGDITGKMIVPIIAQDDRTFTSTFLGRAWKLDSEKSVTDLEKRIRYSGYYPIRTTPEEKKKLDSDSAEVDRIFSEMMVDGVKRWVGLTEQKLKDSGVRCYITPGNDDRFDIDQVFEDGGCVINPEGKVIMIDDKHEMISTGYANMTPWSCPRDISEEELAKKIEDMVSKVSDMPNCVFNFHCPPYDSGLDTAPKLRDLKPVVEPGGQVMESVGSTAVRAAIEKYQPLMGLHGHIHESKSKTNLGRTLCLNPGSEYGEGILRGALLELDAKSVRSYQFTSG